MIRFQCTYDNGDHTWAGKTGKIPCLNGFTAEVRLITPAEWKDDWYCGTTIFLAADQIHIDDCDDRLRSLRGKDDDPSAMVYGFDCNGRKRYNLKETSQSLSLGILRDDVLTIRYSKQDQTVNFACLTLDYF